MNDDDGNGPHPDEGPVVAMPVEPVVGLPSDGRGAVEAASERAPRLVRYLVAVLAGGALTAVVLALSGSQLRLPGASVVASPAPTATPADTSRTLAGKGNVLGDQDALITIELWSDYQCPYCGLLAKAIEPALIRERIAPGEASLTYRDFAFLGQESIDAAVAARCAGQQGAYWRYHDLLFATQQGENQGTFSAANLAGIANVAGIEGVTFAACVADPTVAAAVQAETAAGRANGVESTPTLRISGPGGTQTITGFATWEPIEAAIDRVAVPHPSETPGPSGVPAVPSGASAAPMVSPSPTP